MLKHNYSKGTTKENQVAIKLEKKVCYRRQVQVTEHLSIF